MKIINLLIVDDHPVFRQGLRDVFETDAQLQVVGDAADGNSLLETVRESKPDVILMDINLPSVSGLHVTSRIKREIPAVKVIMITGYDDTEQIYYSFKSGASGFCSKDLPPEVLIRAVHTVVAGNFVINQKVYDKDGINRWLESRMERYGNKALDGAEWSPKPLSPREWEILELICQGSSNKEIAQNLDISYQTVKNHVTAILHKLDVSDRTQAVLFALRNGWFQLES